MYIYILFLTIFSIFCQGFFCCQVVCLVSRHLIAHRKSFKTLWKAQFPCCVDIFPIKFECDIKGFTCFPIWW